MVDSLPKIKKYKPTFILYIFCLLFAPPIIPKINVGLIVALFSFGLIFVKYKDSYIKTLKSSGILRFSAFFVLFLVCLAFTTALNSLILGEWVGLLHYITLWYRYFLIVPVLAFASLYICLRAKELNYSPYDLLYCFILATLIQFGLVFITLLFPDLKDLFIKIIYQNTGDEYLSIPWVTDRRGFGFSNTFVDSFGWGMGLVASLPLFLIKKENFKPVLLIPFLLSVSLVNARTGIVMFAIGVAFGVANLFFSLKGTSLKAKLKALGIINLAIAILVVLCIVILMLNPLTLKWVGSGIASFLPDTTNTEPNALTDAIDSLKNDADTTTSEVLFSDRFWNLPENYILIFGSGHSLNGAKGYQNSDVGYVNDIWVGGLMGCAILYLALLLVFKTAFKSAKNFNLKALVLFFAICFFVFQIKANAITFSAGLNTTLPILFYIIYHSKNRQSSQKPTVSMVDKISVIVPVYNVEKYLERCVISVLNQSYKNLEVILIDDGSTDKSGALCDALAKSDPRIRVYHTKNSGLSEARNFGLEKSSGEYVCFIDSDDFIKPDFLLYLIWAIRQNSSDIAACGYEMYFNKLFSFEMVGEGNLVYTNAEAIKGLFTGEKTVDVMAWNKLYSKKLFENCIRYPKGLLHEDVATTYKLLYKANSISYVALPLYCYFQRRGSIVGGGSFNEKRLTLVKTVEGIKPVIKKFDFDCSKEYEFYVFLNNLHLLNSMIVAKYKDKETINSFKNRVLKQYTEIKQKMPVSLSLKLSCFAISVNLNIYKFLRRGFNNLKIIRGLFYDKV